MALRLGTLNHVELVYPPGGRSLAKRAFELLGCNVTDDGGIWFKADGHVFASEVTPEQWTFEQALQQRRRDDPKFGAESRFADALDRGPQHFFHFGFGKQTVAEWRATVDRIRDAGLNDPELRGRIGIASIFRPGDPGAYGNHFVQAFVRTDLFAAGLLSLGQSVEIQHYFEYDPDAVRAPYLDDVRPSPSPVLQAA